MIRKLPVIAALLGVPMIAASAPSARPRASSGPPVASASSKAPSSSKKKPNQPETKAPSPPPSPPRHIPGPIEITRVQVEVSPERVRITSDLSFSRGEWKEGDLRVHVAYGAPGVPLAFEAQLCASDPDAACSPLPHATEYRAPSDAAFVIGPPVMAGETIDLPSAELAKVLADGSQATLRLRQLRALPAEGASGREVLVRLGEHRGVPYPLGSVIVTGMDGVTLSHVEARLCGVDVEPREIAIVGMKSTGAGAPLSIARREGREDLCVRFKM